MSEHDLRRVPVRLVDVGGGNELGYRVVGRGPDVVLVHGWPLHGLTWRGVVAHLADRFRCHVFDLVGTGASEWSSSTRFRIDTHAADLRRAIDAVGIGPFALVGHDSGGTIARYVAAELGSRVWSSVIADSELPDHRPLLLQLLLAATKLPGGIRGLGMVLRSPTLRRTSLGWGACFHDVERAEGEFHALFGESLVKDPRAIAGQMGLARDFDWALVDRLRELHPRITGPTLLIWGEGDPYFPVAKARAMASQFRAGAELVVYPDARLFPHEEHPERFARDTARFLAMHAPRERGHEAPTA